MFYEVLMEKRAQREHSEFMYKLAHFDDLTPMEKVAIIKQLNKGYNFLEDKANQGYFKVINKMGLGPLEAHNIMQGAMHAGMHGGSAAAAKNAILGTAITKAKNIRKLKKGAQAVENTFNEGHGIGGMLSHNSNLGADIGTYAHGRASLESLWDGAANLVSSAI